MIFWSAHATWSRRFGLDDQRSRRPGLLLVFLVLVYVYPLKILFGGFFHWISGGWIPQVATINSVLDLKLMFIVYGIAFSTLSLLIAALYRQALRAPVTPPLDPHETHQSKAEIVAWRYSAVVAFLSMAFALLLPDHPPGWLTGMPTDCLDSLVRWLGGS